MFDRVFVLEITGLRLDFIRPRLERLPNFRRLFERGAFGRLVGPLQPVVPTSFAALYAGKNPGATGFFDFFRFPAGSYERIPYDLDQLREETFVRRLSDHGKRVGILNSPLLHPLPSLDGFLVSGDEGVGDDYARPPEVLETLRQAGYAPPFGASYSPGREAAFHRHCAQVLEMRCRAARLLFPDRPWDLGMMCLHAYSEMLHAFWRFYDTRHPRYRPFGEVFGGRDPFQELLETLDGTVGEVLDWTGPRGLVLVIGAWGHWLEHTRVHLNRILEREGLLRFKRSPRTIVKRLMFGLGISAAGVERLAHRLNLYKLFHYKLSRGKRAAVTGATFLSFDDIDWPRTQAVATGYLGQVFVNVRGRRPAGAVDPADYGATRERLRGLFGALRDPRTGEPMVERVWRREEIYSGARLDDAPDLVVEFREGYSGQASIGASRRVVAPSPPHHSSEHCKESLLLALGDGVRPGEIEARLQDVAPTVLRALGVPVPPDCEGRVLPIFGS